MQLVIQTGPEAGKQYDLGGKPLVLGKDPQIEISVPDTTMAGQHARFENIGGAIFVADLESGTGTYLNGQRMSPGARYPLRPDDTLRIGSTTFQIKEPVAPAPPVPAANTTGSETTSYGLVANSAAPTGQTERQPYQYQITKIQVPVAPTAPTPVKKAGRKIHWPSTIAALVVAIALIASVLYFVNSNASNTLEINNGQATRTTGRITPGRTPLPPTNTPDLSGATFTGPTPGIGSNVVPITPVQLGPNDLPVYPGARRIDNPTASAVFFTQYITSDSFDKLSDWAKTAFSEKGWTNIEVKNLPGKEGAVLTGRKGNLSAVTYILGPGQKDTPPYDNFFKTQNVDANGAVVVINITAA